MKKTFIHSNSFDPKLNMDSEVNLAPSMTIPDMSLTVQEIIDMYTRGQIPPVAMQNAIGYPDPDFDDLDPTQEPAFDIVDAHRMLAETKQKIEEAKRPKDQPFQKTIDDAIKEAESKKTE
ncbi:MAG: hypothetical protein [Microviridae sp.]|nr:MAG: hypothetical protein [Microviridae sp.]